MVGDEIECPCGRGIPQKEQRQNIHRKAGSCSFFVFVCLLVLEGGVHFLWNNSIFEMR